ncbi:MAG: hypothetical protein KJ734_02700 [Chloroflexi bacterium]|nr:hypothetical protein [Chloroflexota bacterium]
MNALFSPAAYLIFTGQPLQLPPGRVYAYVMAGNGLWKYGESRHLTALVPVARARVAGLPPLTAHVALRAGGRLPVQVLEQALVDARRRAWPRPTEAAYHVALRDQRVQLVYPPQQAQAARVCYYAGGDDLDVVLDLHSHHELGGGAFFSAEDNRDQQGFRLYAVMGHIYTAPEIRLRVGLYGNHMPVPVATVFDSAGPLRDLEVCHA